MKPFRLSALAVALLLAACTAAPTDPARLDSAAPSFDGGGSLGSGNNSGEAGGNMLGSGNNSGEGGNDLGSGNNSGDDWSSPADAGGNTLGSGNNSGEPTSSTTSTESGGTTPPDSTGTGRGINTLGSGN